MKGKLVFKSMIFLHEGYVISSNFGSFFSSSGLWAVLEFEHWVFIFGKKWSTKARWAYLEPMAFDWWFLRAAITSWKGSCFLHGFPFMTDTAIFLFSLSPFFSPSLLFLISNMPFAMPCLVLGIDSHCYLPPSHLYWLSYL